MSLFNALFLSTVSGFVFLSFEIMWIRFFSFATKSSPMIFGIVLAVYLFGIALSAKLIPKYRSALYPVLIISAVLCYLVMPITIYFYTLWFYAFKYGLIFVFTAALSFGGLFPLIVHCSVKNDNEVGKHVSFIYTANIVGSAFGTLLTGFFLLDVLPLRTVSAIMTCCLLLLAVIHRKKYSTIISFLVITTIIIFNNHLHSHMYEKLMYMPRSKLLPPFERVIENKNGVITVAKDKRVYGDGAYDGVISTALSPKVNPEIENAYLVFLFHKQPKNILEIGLSAGAWAQVIVNGPGVKSLTSIEINPGYLELIKEHDEVSSLLSNPLFNVIIQDGRKWLTANPNKKFDVIVMNTTFHWRSHATNLLSIDFMKILKEHLNPGGIVYINTTGSESSVNTIASSFTYTEQYNIYVIASDSPISVDKKSFGTILKNYKIDGKPVLDLHLKTDLDMYKKLTTGLILNRSKKQREQNPIITDDNMVTEYTYLKKKARSKRKK